MFVDLPERNLATVAADIFADLYDPIVVCMWVVWLVFVGSNML